MPIVISMTRAATLFGRMAGFLDPATLRANLDKILAKDADRLKQAKALCDRR